jgi:hypothetical protein
MSAAGDPHVWALSSAREPAWVDLIGVPRPCKMVADFSGTGAVLIFSTPTEVPAQFKLYLRESQVFQCRVKSNNGLVVKVVIQPAPSSAG